MKTTVSWLLFVLMIGFANIVNAQYSLEFNGDSEYVALNGADFAPPWTIQVMVNKTETDNYQHLLTGNDGNSGIRIEQWWGTKIGFTLSGVADYTFNYVLPIGQWVHVALVNNGSSTTLYANGVSKGTINASINFPLKWISKNTNDAAMKAKIDELSIWNTALTQEVIQQFMDQPIEPSHPYYDNLLHYYKFDEGSGNTCFDSKGNLNGTIYGAVYYTETNTDAMISKLVYPETLTDNFSSSEVLIVRVKNNGLLNIEQDFNLTYVLNELTQVSVSVPTGSDPLTAGESIDISFPPINLNSSGTYNFTFYTSLPGDENHSNDTLNKTLVSVSQVLGDVTGFSAASSTFDFSCGTPKVKVVFYKPDMFRIWLAPNGAFTNPAGNNIVVSYEFPPITVNWSDQGNYYKMESDSCVLRAYKTPLTFALYKKGNSSLIWEETSPLDFGTRTFQELSRQENEFFYGCGMQNGYFSHRDKVIKISKETDNWDDGAVPNPVPFYMSTNGYGVFRNTFGPGTYDFRQPVITGHQENRFDAFYFVGNSLKKVLNLYTELTGRPILPPRWGLELGDADCYNDNGQTTPVVISQIADKYREYDLPGGWILPNDGYGCGYTELDSVVTALHERGFYTGLWTENEVSQIQWEVGVAGTRACKLDVAWVGSGYLNALNACKSAYQGIENNCNDRGYVWSVCGWAGTQRYSVVWSGDQSGNWEYIRFHIPTIIGSGLSGYNLASSDLDGIFGGSSLTYVRDLQWKTFIPVFYAMSGWAANMRQPWVYGQTIMDINRKYLKLKMRLTPYMYTLCNDAYETGVPAVRAMVLEFPDDPETWGTRTKYQFMSGESFLVAPVYKSGSDRDSIYFPTGKWIDYWDGTVYEGPMTLNNYPVTIDKLPVFVKAGAIVPMYPEMLYDGQYPKDPLTLDIYPDGFSEFTLYEDDGVSRAHREDAFAKTHISCTAPDFGAGGQVMVTVGESIGDFEGKLDFRANLLDIHFPALPFGVLLNGDILPGFFTPEEFEAAIEGYYFDPNDRNGIVHVKTQPLPTDSEFVVMIDFTGNVDDQPMADQIRIFPNPTTGSVKIELPEGKPTEITVYNPEGKAVFAFITNKNTGKNLDINLSGEPAGVYHFMFKTANRVISRKVSLLK